MHYIVVDLEATCWDTPRPRDRMEIIETDHVNLKNEFAAWKGVRRCGMAKALEHLGLPLVGTHHRGIDDARNIARIAQTMLPHLTAG